MGDHVRRFRLGDEVDTFVVRTQRLLVVVDTMSTPADARWLREQIAGDLAGRSLIVVDTHADYDHAWGNSEFADVPIIGHARCGERLQGDEAAADIARWSAEMPGRFDEVVATPPSILHGDDGLVLDGGDVTIELIHTPGHCADHVSLYLREPRILLAGDAAEVPFPHIDTPEGLVRGARVAGTAGRARRHLRAAVPRRHDRSGRAGAQHRVDRRRHRRPRAALRGGARAVRRRP